MLRTGFAALTGPTTRTSMPDEGVTVSSWRPGAAPVVEASPLATTVPLPSYSSTYWPAHEHRWRVGEQPK